MFGMSNFLKLPRDSWPVFLFFSNDEVFLLNGPYPLTCVPRRLCCWTTCGRGNRPIQLRNDWLLVCHLWHAAWSRHVIGFVWVREGAYSGFVHATEHYCSLCAFLMNLHLPSRTYQKFYLSILLLLRNMYRHCFITHAYFDLLYPLIDRYQGTRQWYRGPCGWRRWERTWTVATVWWESSSQTCGSSSRTVPSTTGLVCELRVGKVFLNSFSQYPSCMPN